MTSQISGLCRDSDMTKSLSLTNVRRLWRFLSSKETKSSLVSITFILQIVSAYQDKVKHGKTAQMSDFISYAESLSYVAAFYWDMCREQDVKAVNKTVHLVTLIGKGCLIFLCLLMLRYLVLQDIKYCIRMVSTWPQNNRTSLTYNFRFLLLMLVCLSA